ncbi:MAG: phage tail protein, partial [Acinetobacter sp.]
EILTDYTAMNKPESDVNDENFKAAADRIYTDGLGISWAIQQKQCKEAIDELLYHIEAGIRVNRQTGKYEVVLFRDDLLELDDAMIFNESNMKSFNPEISTSDDLVNTINVKFYDRENIKDSAFSIYENGNIRTTDQEISEDATFPYFTNRRNADLVANWKLKQLSTPAWKGTFTTGKYDARKLNRYDVIKLSWSDLGIVELPVRVMKISLGDGLDNEVSIDFVEVLPYSSIDYQPINVDPPTNVILPSQPNISTVFEMPYFEAVQVIGQTQLDAELANNPDIGYVMIASKKPQNNSLNALVYVKDTDIYEQRGVANYCPYAELDQNISYLDTSFSVKNVDSILSVSSGSVFKIGSEFLVYVAYNAVTKTLVVKRGALDTIPKKHNSGDKLFFYDEYPSFVRTQYLDSEVIKAKVLTTTPSSVLSLSAAPELELEFNARMIRPYPPADVKFNSNYFIESMINTSDLVVTWVDRNRLQQTGGNVLSWVDGGVTIENGTTYSIELSSESTVISTVSNMTANTHTLDKSTLLPNKMHKLKLWSVRSGYDSYQIFEHEFFVEAIEITLTATATKTNVSGSTVPSAAMSVVVDETLTANIKWNGTSIKGKAEAGATITIEVNT